VTKKVLYLNAMGIVTAQGLGAAAVSEVLFQEPRPCFSWTDGLIPDQNIPVGAVTA
jgi:hypothetical protein